MVRYVAFLRGINGGGQRTVSTEELHEYMAMPGFENITTYVQSDNVLFETDETDEDELCRRIETQLKLKLGYEVRVILRMFHEVRNVIKNNPYDHIKTDYNRNLYVTFLNAVPSPAVRGALEVYSNDAEDARLMRREVYILSNNYGKTCFPLSLIEKKFGVTGTTRDWSTLNKIMEL
jgi:uncharacterized protein (DUF1697 family)